MVLAVHSDPDPTRVSDACRDLFGLEDEFFGGFPALLSLSKAGTTATQLREVILHAAHLRARWRHHAKFIAVPRAGRRTGKHVRAVAGTEHALGLRSGSGRTSMPYREMFGHALTLILAFRLDYEIEAASTRSAAAVEEAVEQLVARLDAFAESGASLADALAIAAPGRANAKVRVWSEEDMEHLPEAPYEHPAIQMQRDLFRKLRERRALAATG